MNLRSWKYWTLILFVGLLLGSCVDDTDIDALEEKDTEVATAAGALSQGGNNGGPNGGGQGQQGNPRPPRGNQSTQIVEDWIEVFLEVERYAAEMRPNATARALGYIHLAAYETYVPATNTLVSNAGKIPGFDGIEAPVGEIDYVVALNEVYRLTLDHFLTNVPAEYDALIQDEYDEINRRITRNVDAQTIDLSQEWGAIVADAIIAYARTDAQGEAQIRDVQPTSYIPPTGAGYWTFSAEPERALFPYWESVRTFVVSTDETTTIPPMTYSSVEGTPYYQQMLDVYEANNQARDRDGEQLWIAEFWSDDVEGITFSPPSRQFAIAEQLIDQYDMTLADALRMNVKLGFAMNDAAVSTWKYKYEHMVMRPSVFIQEYIDPEYQTNLYRLIPWPNPTFPAYPSGHSAFASAAAGVFIDFFGQQTNFTDRSHEGRREFRGRPRRFRSFADMAEENAYSRIPLGVHIEIDCTEGLRLGYEVSDGINAYQLTN